MPVFSPPSVIKGSSCFICWKFILSSREPFSRPSILSLGWIYWDLICMRYPRRINIKWKSKFEVWGTHFFPTPIIISFTTYDKKMDANLKKSPLKGFISIVWLCFTSILLQWCEVTKMQENWGPQNLNLRPPPQCHQTWQFKVTAIKWMPDHSSNCSCTNGGYTLPTAMLAGLFVAKGSDEAVKLQHLDHTQGGVKPTMCCNNETIFKLLLELKKSFFIVK